MDDLDTLLVCVCEVTLGNREIAAFVVRDEVANNS